MTAIALLLALPAFGGAVTTSANAGWDFQSSDLWSGFELAVHPTHTEGLAFIGRLSPGWGFAEAQPRLATEFGFASVIPHEEATIRVGAVGHMLWTRAAYTLPINLATDDVYTGMIPSVMGLVEFEYGETWRYAIGARAGVGPELTNMFCPEEEPDPSCFSWTGGFAGGFYARARLPSGFAAELMAGPSIALSIGWAW